MNTATDRQTASTATESYPPGEPRKSRLRWRFSLATLFILMLLVAAALAWFRAHEVRYRREAEARAKVRELGGWCNERPVRFGRLGRILAAEDWQRTDGVDFSAKSIPDPSSVPKYIASKADDDSIAVLTSFPDLNSLRLTHSHVTGRGLACLRHSSQLEYLVLDNNLLGDVAFLQSLKRVRVLNLVQTGIGDEDLAQLAGLSELITLDLGQNPIEGTGLGHLSGLHKLSLLKLQATKITDDSLSQFEMPAIWGLHLDGTKVTGRGFEKLGEQKSLTHLQLADAPVDDAGLTGIAMQTNLQALDLSGTQITDDGLPTLDRLFALKYLSVKGTQVTKAGIEQFLRVHPNCRVEFEP